MDEPEYAVLDGASIALGFVGEEVVEDFNHLIGNYLETFKVRGKEQQMKDFIRELMESEAKFKAGATSLEVIRNPQKYIPKYSATLSNMELEDVISQVDDAGDFRFDIKWTAKNQDNDRIYIFVDTKNYSRASNMFTDLGQFKAYLEKIDSFDQLYIIQQHRSGVTREQMIKRLRNELLKDKNLIEVFNIIRSKPQMNRDLLKNIEDNDIALEELTRLIKDPNSFIYTAILITK